MDDRRDNPEYKQLLARLGSQQRQFVEEYLSDFNGTAAAMRAGYSPRTARQQASRLLKNQAVRDAIDAGQHLDAEESWLKAMRVRRRMEAGAFASIADFLDERGRLLPREKWPADADHAVQSITVKKGSRGETLTTLTLTNRISALSRLWRILEVKDEKGRSVEAARGVTLSTAEFVFMELTPMLKLMLAAGWRIKSPTGEDLRLEQLDAQLMVALKLKETHH